MNARNLSIKIIIALILISCEKQELVLSKMYINMIRDPIGSTDLFTYDDGKLILFQRYFGQTEETVTTFLYNDQLLTNITIVRSNGQKYFIDLDYFDNLRSKETITIIEGDSVIDIATSIFKYDLDGNLESRTTTHTNKDSGSTETEFKWTDGNIVQMKFYQFIDSNKVFAYSRSLTYDDKVNFTNQNLSLRYRTIYEQESSLSKNNILTSFDSLGQVRLDRGSFLFKYNEKGYPIEYVYKVDQQAFPVVTMTYN